MGKQWANEENVGKPMEKQGKPTEKPRKIKENNWKKQGTWRKTHGKSRTKLLKWGKTDGKTRKMKEQQWTSNENCGKPLKMHGKQRTTIGKHKEKQTRTKNEKRKKKTRWSPRTRMPTRMLRNTDLILMCHNFQRTHLWNTLTWHTEVTLL